MERPLNDELRALVREPAGEPEGALVLLHGRGADEHDLYPLLDALDPERRLLGVTPRAPLALPPGGAHWYALHEIGYPDPATFDQTYPRAASWLDSLGFPMERVVLGGFSQGCVMTYALGLGAGRPRPAALICLSGFMPTVPGFELDLSQPLPPVAIGHGTYDHVIGAQWGRQARDRLEAAGANVIFRESPLDHTIDPRFVPQLREFVRDAVRDTSARNPSPSR